MNKILLVSTVGLIYDGITNVILSNISVMNKKSLKFYVVNTIKSEKEIIDSFEKLGCKVVEFPDRKEDTLRYFFELYKFIKSNKIDVIHVNGNSATCTIELLAAKLAGCKRRIVHSHNTRCDAKKADKLLRPIFYLTYTNALACGYDAGKWLFGDRQFKIIKNGRDSQVFCFDSSKRNMIRESLGLDNRLTIGHVGGFVKQKNHEFLLNIYKELLNLKPNIELFMIGDGILSDKIKQKAKEFGIFDKIHFTGNISNISDYLQAMDAMVLPSFFEGLPLVTVEWQMEGLPCFISDTVTKECAFSSNIYFLSLNEDAKYWAKKILDYTKKENRAVISKRNIDKAKKIGYEIRSSAEELRNIYLGEE